MNKTFQCYQQHCSSHMERSLSPCKLQQQALVVMTDDRFVVVTTYLLVVTTYLLVSSKNRYFGKIVNLVKFL